MLPDIFHSSTTMAAAVVATVSASLTLINSIKVLLASFITNKPFNFRNESERLLETLESLESFYNARTNDELYKKPGISKIFQNTWKLLREIKVKLENTFPKKWMIKKRRTLKSFVQRSSDKLQHNEQEMDRLIQRMVNERALERDAVPQTGEADEPQAPNSATDGPGLSQRLSISSNHSQRTMSETVAMDVDQKMQAQYIPKDYPHFKMTLFKLFGDENIDELVTLFNIPRGLMSEGSNKGNGTQLKMVQLLEQKCHISADSIDGMMTALGELPFEGPEDAIKALYQDFLSHGDSNFGRFKVALANQFTNDIMYGLATLLNFQPAEINDIIPESRGMKLILRLEQRNSISEKDVSKLIKTLDDENLEHYANVVKELKKITESPERPDLK